MQPPPHSGIMKGETDIMGFWNDVKSEWRKPFKGTKKEKEDFWLNMVGCICGITVGNVFFSTAEMPAYKVFLGTVACVILCDIIVAIFFVLIKKVIK